MMQTDTPNSNENLLILLETEFYHPSTIYRGAQLANALGSPFVVCYGLEEHENDDFSEQLLLNIAEAKQLSLSFGAKDFTVKLLDSERDFKQQIKNFQQDFQISQIVVRAFEESWLSKTLYGSTVNFFVKHFPNIDLHVVSKKLDFPYHDWTYEKGFITFLSEDAQGYFLSNNVTGIKGVFFKEKNAPQQDGTFITVDGTTVQTYPIQERLT